MKTISKDMNTISLDGNTISKDSNIISRDSNIISIDIKCLDWLNRKLFNHYSINVIDMHCIMVRNNSLRFSEYPLRHFSYYTEFRRVILPNCCIFVHVWLNLLNTHLYNRMNNSTYSPVQKKPPEIGKIGNPSKWLISIFFF